MKARAQRAVETKRPFGERLAPFWSNPFSVSASRPIIVALTGAFGGALPDVIKAWRPGTVAWRISWWRSTESAPFRWAGCTGRRGRLPEMATRRCSSVQGRGHSSAIGVAVERPESSGNWVRFSFMTKFAALQYGAIAGE